MAKNPRQRKTLVTKKHQARLERERTQSRYILIGALITAIVVILLVGYGILNETVLKQMQPVATVNGERISTRDFQEQARYMRLNIINNASSLYQFAQAFSSSPDTQMQLAMQLAQAQNSLQSATLGQEVLNQMIEDLLIRQDAKKRGITIGKEELELAMQEAFGYFPNGTPTTQPTLAILPTSTLSPQQMTLVPPTPTATATSLPTATDVPTMTATLAATTLAPASTPTLEVVPTQAVEPTITPTSGPTATPTEYTQDLYQQNYKDTVQRFKDEIDLSEATLRRIIESNLYRQKVQEAVLAELDVRPEEEQIWARHILVPDEALAAVVLEKINAGEDWYSLAAQYSEDPGSKNIGGDLGWFGRGKMVAEFENAAFNLQVGEVSQAVQSSFGYHIIQVLGRENRSLDESAYEQLKSEKFQEWLTAQRDASKVEIQDFWIDRVPSEPALPDEIAQFVQYIQQLQSQPVQPAELPEAQPTP